MPYVRQQWERLLERLNTWGTAVEVAPGRIDLTYETDGGVRRVEIVMTAEDWDDFAGVIWGDFDDAAEDLRQSVVEVPSDMPFLVYDTYELVPSPTPELPEDPEEARLNALAREHPEGIGTWVVLDADGNVLDALGPEPD